MSKKIKYKRDQSFRKGGRTYFFSTGDEKEEDDFYSFKKKIPKRKRIKFPKKCKGKLVMSK